jgi:hypothetical protein
MRTPSSALPAWPQGLLEGRGMPFAAARFGAVFFPFNFTTVFTRLLALERVVFVLALIFFVTGRFL